MKNIKKAPVKFQEDLLYFQHFMLIFVFAQINDYHHLKVFRMIKLFEYSIVSLPFDFYHFYQ